MDAIELRVRLDELHSAFGAGDHAAVVRLTVERATEWRDVLEAAIAALDLERNRDDVPVPGDDVWG